MSLWSKVLLTLLLAALSYPAYHFWQFSTRPPIYAGIFTNEIEIYREELIFDVEFCMRVLATPSEIDVFLDKAFEDSQRVAVAVDEFGNYCSASFWPVRFSKLTIAYEAFKDEETGKYGSRGAVLENGTLYYWVNSI